MIREAVCYVCGGKGWTIPKVWSGVNPPPPDECSLCHGTGRIKDPELLCKGMEIYNRREGGLRRTVSHLRNEVVFLLDGGQLEFSCIRKSEPWATVTYMGMAGEEKAVPTVRWQVSNDGDNWMEVSGPGVATGFRHLRRLDNYPPTEPVKMTAARQPAKCRPDCTPRTPCRTEAVCPVFAEERVGMALHNLNHTGRLLLDRDEAQRWRSQRWEPGMNGHGALVGRYRVSRR